MNSSLPRLLSLLAFGGVFAAQAEPPSLTIYNQDFAVVRDTVTLDLKGGVTDVRFTGTTAHLEPQSVILRDPAGKVQLHILEQNYLADPVSEGMLLAQNEGKTIDFIVNASRFGGEIGAEPRIVKGKIIRAGYVMHSTGLRRYGSQYIQSQQAMASDAGTGQPIVEVDGKLRFGLPGMPLFPSLGDDAILKPTLDWKIQSDQAAKVDAELGYVTGGMSWQADYSVVAPEQGDLVDVVGLVTMDNQSGKTFDGAKIKLMAGDVAKLQRDRAGGGAIDTLRFADSASTGSAVTEKAFDEYHLYSLPRPTSLRDRETKQVEFVRAAGVPSSRYYVYDGAKIDWRRYGSDSNGFREQTDFGAESNPKVWTIREIKNSEANHLGLPLPKGQVRFYRRDADGQFEFTGENLIDHTPKDETLKLFTGSAFDLTGERKRTDFRVDRSRSYADEAFEIRLRNHKKDTAEIRVVEHLYRGRNWEIVAGSDAWTKTDAQTIEFRVKLKPDEEKVVTYKVHYTW